MSIQQQRRSIGPLALAMVILSQPAAGVEDDVIPSWLRGELGLSIGVDLSSGDYGEEKDTNIVYVPFSVTYLFDDFPLTSYRGDRIELGVTVSYVRIRGPAYVLVETGGAVSLDASTLSGRQAEQGIGDVITRLSYLFAPPPASWLPFVEASAKVKIPTADTDKGLGTGETDVTVDCLVSKRFGNFTPFGGLGYRWMGDPPGYDLDNRWLASAGALYHIGNRWRAGLIYDWRQSASSWTEDAHELVPYVSIHLSPKLLLQPYGIVGLSEGSPNLGGGLQIRTSIPFR